MGKLLARYKGIVADEILDSIKALAGGLAGRSILHVHSGRLQPDVVDTLSQLGEHFVDVGINFRETTIVGTENFFDVIRLAEDGPAPREVARRWTASYDEIIAENARKTFLSSDLVVIHGLQPLGLVDHRPDDRPWLWRCHANLKGAAAPLWSFVNRFVSCYQGAAFSHPSFVPALPIPSVVLPPSVDPFAPVNRRPSPEELAQVLAECRIPSDAPLALWLLGSESTREVLDAIRTWKAGHTVRKAILAVVRAGPGGGSSVSRAELGALEAVDSSVRLLSLPRDATREICALGWACRLVIDPSHSRWPNWNLLGVMWKGAPALVAAGSANAAFIAPDSGYCTGSPEELSRRIGELLENPGSAREMGSRARQSIARRHLMPHHLLDYLKLLKNLPGRVQND